MQLCVEIRENIKGHCYTQTQIDEIADQEEQVLIKQRAPQSKKHKSD